MPRPPDRVDVSCRSEGSKAINSEVAEDCFDEPRVRKTCRSRPISSMSMPSRNQEKQRKRPFSEVTPKLAAGEIRVQRHNRCNAYSILARANSKYGKLIPPSTPLRLSEAYLPRPPIPSPIAMRHNLLVGLRRGGNSTGFSGASGSGSTKAHERCLTGGISRFAQERADCKALCGLGSDKFVPTVERWFSPSLRAVLIGAFFPGDKNPPLDSARAHSFFDVFSNKVRGALVLSPGHCLFCAAARCFHSVSKRPT